MNDLSLSLGFAIGAIFTTCLMVIFKYIFFSMFQTNENKEIKKRLKELENTTPKEKDTKNEKVVASKPFFQNKLLKPNNKKEEKEENNELFK